MAENFRVARPKMTLFLDFRKQSMTLRIYQAADTPATFLYASASVFPRDGRRHCEPGSVLPWRQVSRAGRFTGPACDRVGPLNQTAVIGARRANKINGAIVCRNMKRHGRTQDEAGCGERSWGQLP
jgi:hypothetical protein